MCPDSRQASPTATCDLFIVPGKELALFTAVLVVCIVTSSQATGEINRMYASYKFLRYIKLNVSQLDPADSDYNIIFFLILNGSCSYPIRGSVDLCAAVPSSVLIPVYD